MDDVTRHYGSAGLTARILGALDAAGVDLGVEGRSALAGVDEFHLGGHRATLEVTAAVEAGPDDHIVDLGCGIGGAARHIADATGCRVSGIDLTPEFVTAATELTDVLGMTDRLDFRVGSATDIPAEDQAFDMATLVHVGMNIADKAGLAAEVRRVLRPGGRFVVYDVMRVGPGDITYPVPWASSPEWSFVESPTAYAAALERAGFALESQRDMTELVLDTLAAARDAGPAPASLVTLMGADFPAMIGNLVPLLHQGTLAPVLMTAVLVPNPLRS